MKKHWEANKTITFSHRTVKNDKQVLLGETAQYEPLCRECYQRALQEDREKS